MWQSKDKSNQNIPKGRHFCADLFLYTYCGVTPKSTWL